MSVDILGTSWDQCRSTVQEIFTSAETRRLVRTDSPGRPPRLSHISWTMHLSYTWYYYYSPSEAVISIIRPKQSAKIGYFIFRPIKAIKLFISQDPNLCLRCLFPNNYMLVWSRGKRTFFEIYRQISLSLQVLLTLTITSMRVIPYAATTEFLWATSTWDVLQAME